MSNNLENIQTTDDQIYDLGSIDQVVITPNYLYSLLAGKKNMDYYLQPRRELNGKSIARALNSGYISPYQIQGMKEKSLQNDETAKYNRSELLKAQRYAGSDRASMMDRQFFNNLGLATTGIISLPALPQLASGLYAGAVTAPTWIPWTAKNVVVPYLAGEIVNNATNTLSNGKYNTFGNYVYEDSGLNTLVGGTWLEQPTKFVAEMLNPGYISPWTSIIKNTVPVVQQTTSNLMNNIKAMRLQSPVIISEQSVVPLTSNGIQTTPELYASSIRFRSPIYNKRTPPPTASTTPSGEIPEIIENTEFVFRKPIRELLKRDVKIDKDQMRELNKLIKTEGLTKLKAKNVWDDEVTYIYGEPISPKQFYDDLAKEADIYYQRTGEQLSPNNVRDILYNVQQRGIKRVNLRNEKRIAQSKAGEGMYTEDQIKNINEQLKELNSALELDPYARQLNSFWHPVSNKFSPKPWGWSVNHPYLSIAEHLWPFWTSYWGQEALKHSPDLVKLWFKGPNNTDTSDTATEEAIIDSESTSKPYEGRWKTENNDIVILPPDSLLKIK